MPFHMLPGKSFIRGFSESVDRRGQKHRRATLQHAKSLDELLDYSGSEAVTVVFDRSESSKYSRVTITASSEMLDKNLLKENQTNLHSPGEYSNKSDLL